ncbi:MAG: tetratricopeptide repeat protein [Planctomycetaceae bacterium]
MAGQKIYLGGVTHELLPYRQRAEAILRRRGYEPVFCERHNPRDQQALKTLRKTLAGCDAVICLVGFQFGDEPMQRGRGLPRRSFAQWEYALAQELNKPVYRFMSHFENANNAPPSQAHGSGEQASEEQAVGKQTASPVAAEPAELRALQQEFRDDEQNDERLWEFDDPSDFERKLAVLRFPWEPGVGDEKLVLLPYHSLGECFVGRTEALAELDTNRQGPPDAEGRRAVALVSLLTSPTLGAGEGKTRLAVEYAQRHLADFSAVAWISGHSLVSLEAGLANLAYHPDLNLSAELDNPTDEDRITAVIEWFEINQGWLLIVDGVDIPEARDDVLEMLQHLTGGMLLLTGRVGNYPPWVSILPVESWKQGEGVEYLLRSTDQLRWRTADEETAARELAKLTRELPLALEWAAAVIRQNRLSFAEYLARWHENARWVAQQAEQGVLQDPEWVVTTWRTTYQQLSPAEQLVLDSLAWYAPVPLCREWFEGTTAFIHFLRLLKTSQRAGILPVARGPFVTQELLDNRLFQTLRHLNDYRLIDVSANSDAAVNSDWLLVSRLTRDVTRSQMSADRAVPVITYLLNFVRDLLGPSEWKAPTDPPDADWLSLAPHVEVVAMAGADLGIAMPTSQLLNDLAEHLDGRFHVDRAMEILRRGIELQQKVGTHQSAILEQLLYNLGQMVREEDQTQEAEPLLQRALAIAERRLGPNDPKLVPLLCELILCLQDLNRNREAEPLLRRVLVIEERRWGPEHYNVQVHRGNLGVLMLELGQRDEAEVLLRKTLRILEKTVGTEDPGYLRCLTNLGHTLQQKGNRAEAEKVIRQSLELAEARFGKKHYEVVWRCMALGAILLNNGDSAQAEPWLRRAADSGLPARQDEPLMFPRLFRLLGQSLARQGKTAEAEEWYRKSLALLESQVGPDHPEVGTLLGHLASTLEANNRADEAWELCDRRVRCYFLDSAKESRPHPEIGSAMDQYFELGTRRGLSEREVIERVYGLLRQTGCPPQLLSEFADDHLAQTLRPLRDAESRRN